MKKLFIVLAFFVTLLIFIVPVFAHCPLCTAATGALVTTTRMAGIDDAVIGTFIGAFIISTAFWFNKFLVKRLKKQLPLQPYILSILFLIITIASFHLTGLFRMIPESFYILGVEKLVFGMVLGSIVTIVAFNAHSKLRKLNKNKNYLPFQGIVFPIILLVVVDASLYVLGVI